MLPYKLANPVLLINNAFGSIKINSEGVATIIGLEYPLNLTPNVWTRFSLKSRIATNVKMDYCGKVNVSVLGVDSHRYNFCDDTVSMIFVDGVDEPSRAKSLGRMLFSTGTRNGAKCVVLVSSCANEIYSLEWRLNIVRLLFPNGEINGSGESQVFQ